MSYLTSYIFFNLAIMNIVISRGIAFIVLCLIFSGKVLAQFSWVQIGVDGLTCSQCSRNVEMSIRKLDFVKDVKMNLENTEGKVIFHEGPKVNIEKIAQAVFDAGFSVRYLKAGFVFNNLSVSNGFNWTNDNEQYCFVKTESKILKGEATLTFIGQKYMPAKEYKEWKKKITECCGVNKEMVYYVTL